jgi:hypothetical protein
MKTFEIKEEHLLLLQKAYIGWDNCEYGAPSIDCKRPYGNSDVENDIAEIFGWEIDEYLTEVQSRIARNLHEETKTTLQICLSLQKFETGVYRQTEEYNDRAWEKI